MSLKSRAIAPRRSKYKILGLAGQGQYGRVFNAFERQSGQLVALKELDRYSSSTSTFLQELRVLLTLQHPNIVACRALEHTATGRYVVMDYCEGGTLRNLLECPHSFTLETALQMVLSILAGLECAHQQGVLHCDLKPENILLTLSPTGWIPRLSDFGIARNLPEFKPGFLYQEVTEDVLQVIGPPAYTAPERFYGLYSPVSDLYSVGIVLFELLMGYRPFSGFINKIMWAHFNQRLELPTSVPKSLRDILQKALEKLPARRFTSASQMRQAIEQAMAAPDVRQLRTKSLPWGDSPETLALPKQAMHAEPQGEPICHLSTIRTQLYAALKDRVQVWEGNGVLTARIELAQPITRLLPWGDGCFAIAGRRIYWIDPSKAKARCVLSFRDDFRLTIDPQGHWCAIARFGELQFYPLDILLGGKSKLLLPKRCVRTGRSQLPEICPLNQRYLTLAWTDPSSDQVKSLNRGEERRETKLQIYARRGTLMGSVTLPLALKRLTATNKPYEFIALEKSAQFTALSIQLRPIKVQQLPLAEVPACFASAPWGSAFAETSGKITLLNQYSEVLSSFWGPPCPTAIAPLGATTLAIATDNNNTPQLHFLDIQAYLIDDDSDR